MDNPGNNISPVSCLPCKVAAILPGEDNQIYIPLSQARILCSESGTALTVTKVLLKIKGKTNLENAKQHFILNWIRNNTNAFSRENTVAHMTASAWVVNQDKSKILMVYHNIYNSWSWLGGHADGETDLLAVALREVKEEAGISHVCPVSEEIFSLESLTVDGHVKICVQPFTSECNISAGSRF